jgi:hypothetical protein
LGRVETGEAKEERRGFEQFVEGVCPKADNDVIFVGILRSEAGTLGVEEIMHHLHQSM